MGRLRFYPIAAAAGGEPYSYRHTYPGGASMNVIDRDTLLTLAARTEWPSASIYLPLDKLGIRTDADRIRLRNLAKQAHDHLVADGVRVLVADDMTATLTALASDDSLWKGGPSGLAVFLTPGGAMPLWVNITMPELSIVGDRFYLRPLLPAFTGERRAWALAIDSNRSRLFHLDPAGVEEVPLPAGTPVSLAEEMQYDQREEQLQYHTMPGATAEGAQGAAAAMFHGHGGEKDADKVGRMRFMNDLSRGVVTAIGAESSEPLVLLGVDYLIDDFREASAYSHIAPERIEGATDYLSPADVQAKVLAALAPRAEAAAEADVAEYRQLAGTGRTSTEASEIVAAAASGRIKTLIMDDSAGPYGYFDRNTLEVTRLCPITPRYLRDTMDAPDGTDIYECGWDLIDLAAAETLKHHGTVRAYRGEDAPMAGAAAVFRY